MKGTQYFFKNKTRDKKKYKKKVLRIFINRYLIFSEIN